MRAVVQRVASARVEVAGEVIGAIDRGLLAYVGFGRGDTDADSDWMLSKILGLRIFADHTGTGKMARSIVDVGGALLLVSQFTLYASLQRGRRPSFDEAMPPAEAEGAYEAFVRKARGRCEGNTRIETGRFGAEMLVSSVNDGPVTIWADSVVAIPRG
jgi:D-aminoacyl-tRNA deacylase